MSNNDLVIVDAERLNDLITNKLSQAGLPVEQAHEVANHLVYADLSGIHSHGAVRVEYYAERIAKGGITKKPNISFEKTGMSTGIIHCDNGMGHYVANRALPDIIQLAKASGVAVVGLSKVSHTGTMAYYLRKIAEENLIGISMCQSDPMVVPFGGSEVYFGTNPLGFGVPRLNGKSVVFDMATSIQAWGKILDARSKGKSIPEGWAVDKNGQTTTDANAVAGLLPIAGPKGYGLMMMIDILSGMLLGLPFGKHVSSMYADLSTGRDLGHLFIIIDPSRFTDLETFKQNLEQQIEELHAIKPGVGFEKVLYPGELSEEKYLESLKKGIEIPKEIMDYLQSDWIHCDRYEDKGAFAK